MSGVAGIRARLLAWYDGVARDLPWRRTRDPWAIWVSEVMLQQTRVETVLRYYARFLERFPTATALADAPVDDVLTLWSGLGYYRRARLLHAGAVHVRDVHGGAVPDDPAAIRAIPGVGAYTTGAIASFAFGRPEPLVDGNVTRVLTRLHGIDQDPRKGEGLAAVWRRAAALVPGERPGALNNALMELGATVCTPTSPGCLTCPLRDPCVARAEGRVDALPLRAERTARPRIEEIALVVRHEGRLVLLRRKKAGLFGGLWEPPRLPATDPTTAGERVAALLGAPVQIASGPGAHVEHVLTHRELSVRVFPAVIAQAPRLGESDTWDAVEVVDGPEGRGTSTLARKLLAAASRAGARDGADGPPPRARARSPRRAPRPR